MNFWREFHGPNAGYIQELYTRYRENPQSVDAVARRYFEQQGAPPESFMAVDGATAVTPDLNQIMGTVNLAQAIRQYGHLAAQLDPLGQSPPGEPSLHPAYHHLSDNDWQQLPPAVVGGPAAANAANAGEAIQNLRQIYASTIGYDYDHLRNHNERQWLREAAECRMFRPISTPEFNQKLLDRLTQVETFELFLHRVFPGKTRFSIEGLDMMVPMLEEIIGEAAESGIFTILIGMAHRGRLNVMAHILQQPYAEILTMFKDPAQQEFYEWRNSRGWTGDVKYHAGAHHTIDFDADDIIDLVIKMAPNPSHLEHINPVIAGMARAAGTQVDQPGAPQFDPSVTLPIIIHGDTAFPGQGVVAETLNMHHLANYHVGGTIHVIANNQLGFTAVEAESRSTLYASDLAKGFKIPIVHVNADDPEACIEVARLAIAYRAQFHKDFLIDLIGYRRYGHNEGDEPRFTQPLRYQKIDAHLTVRQLWAQSLTERGEMSEADAKEIVNKHHNELQMIYESLQADEVADALEPQLEIPPAGAAKRATTAVPLDTLRQLNQSLRQLPAGFNLNPKLARAMEKRQQVLDQPDEYTVDWAAAEELALAAILAEGTAVRFTGEDSERGTFSQRHAVFHDVATGETFSPLQHIPQAKAAFEICNSPLSENAAIGFEYGYNVQAPERLVIWEAQYGDFINTAQAMVDEFIVSGKAKWEQTPSLVLLLPHGYEGQGPDHSTARLERFLQMAAKTSMRIAYPTTAAQYFHLLRRQAAVLREDPLPLIVMTPKSLLRHFVSASTPNELAHGEWRRVLNDKRAIETADTIHRLILCSGKVYADLLPVQQAIEDEHLQVALVRVEQLYPFPEGQLKTTLANYPQLEEVVWLQEEPANMGAWSYMRFQLEAILGDLPLRYIGRPSRSSPAEGSTTWHKRNQQAITEHAFKFKD